ncbi:uncharacterized protein BJX67DRAFT_383465 [Aspergillus lucknowensis]|uniref:Uncharacterized protein n=1 Tax=Aspergillus lucknowensis TaxID=176173 RepID=A0ABR4LN42_9EURO
MKKPMTDSKAGARIDNPGSDGLDGERAYDSGFKYQIPEAGYNGNNEPIRPAHQQSLGDRPPTAETGSRRRNPGGTLGSAVMGLFAGIHGAGEWLRGEINATVDRTFGNEEGLARNKAIARNGQREITSGQFSQSNNDDSWRKFRRE